MDGSVVAVAVPAVAPGVAAASTAVVATAVAAAAPALAGAAAECVYMCNTHDDVYMCNAHQRGRKNMGSIGPILPTELRLLASPYPSTRRCRFGGHAMAGVTL